MSSKTDAGSGRGHRVDVFTDFKVGDRIIERDEPGYLVDPQDWDEEVAQVIAKEEGVELDEERWEIIRYMRTYQEEHQIAPDARFVFQFIADKNGLNKKDARQKFFEMFPYGYVKQPLKIAGLKQPRAWSTG